MRAAPQDVATPTPLRAPALAAASDVAAALASISARLAAASARAGRAAPPRLVAVSKTKPLPALAAAYAAGQRVFGENYVQELLDKAPQMPADVSWHFIGHLQTNKAKALVAGVPNLACVETVDSAKLADKLQQAAVAAGRAEALGVLVQVNTSGEESKHGVAPSDAPALATHIAASCPALTVRGLMTIGMPDYTTRPENFLCLASVRDAVASALAVPPSTLELSMGMSGDFEAAAEMGSTSVRVGSSIFGAREYPAAA